MIDLEVNKALYKFYAGMEVSEETMCLDLISEMEFCSQRTYLETEHTARHFGPSGWLPKLIDRSYCDHESSAVVSDETLLERADRPEKRCATGTAGRRSALGTRTRPHHRRRPRRIAGGVNLSPTIL